MSKKKKVRVEFRKNREKPPRENDLTRDYQEGDGRADDAQSSERVRAKGNLSRYRTVVTDAAEDTMPAVNAEECIRGRVLRVHGLASIVETDDGRSLPAQLGGRDPVSDLALLRVADLAIAPATATHEPARVGQIVLAVGRPSSNGPMASLGIVSAVGGPLRTSRGALLDQFIQVDATPYPGFSGGPLIDPAGAVIGTVVSTGPGTMYMSVNRLDTHFQLSTSLIVLRIAQNGMRASSSSCRKPGAP